MSAETVARWNAIPLNRPDTDESAHSSLKRTRQDGDRDDDDSEDNVSLVSRSPSPPPPDAMDVDKYDEYYTRKPEREVVTVETKIKSNNVGFSMLAKMGWVEGSPLGLSGDGIFVSNVRIDDHALTSLAGRVEPVPFYVKNDLTGLGKANQDVRMIETTVSQRRELDSERQTKETEEQRRQREEAVARRAAVKSEISSVLRPFYCEVCKKQFQNVAQYDEHTNSYAHHHKVRFRDMQAAQRANRNTKEEVDKRKEKERKREEKELRKIAKAAGVKMTKPPVALAPISEPAPAPAEPGTDSKPSGFKKSGWATVGGLAGPAEPAKKSGWATVGASQPSSSGGGWATVSALAVPPDPAPAPPPSSSAHPPPPPPQRTDYSSAPAFRTGGWTSLETGGSVPPPPTSTHALALPPPPANIAPPPAPPTAARGGWSTVSGPRSAGWQSVTPGVVPPPPSAPSFGTSAPSSALPVNPTGRQQPPVPEPANKETSRSGWQKFRAGAPGRRR
ncbi:hypothetical protein BD413DRAFT_126422 [Trametes elegans]|nr:hypothetical protein BD413DRAFT_126422 [Trametes elegans]